MSDQEFVKIRNQLLCFKDHNSHLLLTFIIWYMVISPDDNFRWQGKWEERSFPKVFVDHYFQTPSFLDFEFRLSILGWERKRADHWMWLKVTTFKLIVILWDFILTLRKSQAFALPIIYDGSIFFHKEISSDIRDFFSSPTTGVEVRFAGFWINTLM